MITGLGVGGAEVMLSMIVANKSDPEIAYTVICLGPPGVLGEEILRSCPVEFLDLKKNGASALLKLYRMLRREAPDVVQTWLYHSDLIGGLLSRIAGIPTVLWNIRQSNLGWNYNKKLTLGVAAICSALSRIVPDAIIVNSAAAQDAHVKFGYVARKFLVVPNCFDPAEFRQEVSEAGRLQQRKSWGAADEEIVVGTVARFDRQKGLEDFVEMAELLTGRGLPVRFVMVGPGNVDENALLGRWLDSRRVRDRFVLLGERRDIARILNAFDIFVLPSHGESFPNALCEAMLCELACVATDVGDVRIILGAAGKLCPAASPGSLAGCVEEFISEGSERRADAGRRARESICERYSVSAVVARYEGLYKSTW